jgi:Helix-turn-helix domain
MSDPIMPSELLPEMRLCSPPSAASILGVTKDTLAIWRCTKRYQLPYVKIGRKVFYRFSDLQKFIQRRTVGSEPGVSRATRKTVGR